MQEEQAAVEAEAGAQAEASAAAEQAEAESNDPLEKIGDLITKRLKESMESRKKSMQAGKANDVVLDKADEAVKALVKVCEDNGIALVVAVGLDREVITTRPGLSGSRPLTLFMIEQLRAQVCAGCFES